MHQSTLSYHTVLLSCDCDISNISSHAPIVFSHSVLTALAFLHLKCFHHFVQTTLTPHPSMATIPFFHFLPCNRHNPHIKPETILIDLGRIEITFDLQSARLTTIEPCVYKLP